jgi:hypothetical protein
MRVFKRRHICKAIHIRKLGKKGSLGYTPRIKVFGTLPFEPFAVIFLASLIVSLRVDLFKKFCQI